MSQTLASPPKFACAGCGKQFTWKPQIAGKKAKCAGCGGVVSVPLAIDVTAAASPPPPVDEGNPLDDIGDYDFAEPEVKPAPVVKRALPVTAHAGAAATPARRATSAAALGYRGTMTAEEKRKADRFSFGAMLDVKRDIIAPLVVLTLGFLGVIIWAAVNVDASALAVGIVAVGMLVVTLIKTVILTFAAILIAPRFGLSFGDLRTAILKIAAVVVFIDGAMAWMPFGGGFMLRGFALGVTINGLVIAGLCMLMFQMDYDETAMFAVPMAVLSKILNVLLAVAAAGLVMSMAGVNGPAAPAAGGSRAGVSGGGGFGASSSSGGLAVDEGDAEDEDEDDETVRRPAPPRPSSGVDPLAPAPVPAPAKPVESLPF